MSPLSLRRLACLWPFLSALAFSTFCVSAQGNPPTKPGNETPTETSQEPRPFLLGGIQTHELDHERWVAALHRAGMNTVQATVYAHQGPWNTAKLWYSEEEPAVLAEIRAAKRNGLQVVLILRVALDHSDPENRHLWHGLIYPQSEAATREWFRIYGDLVVRWGRIAEREGVDVLGIASEMNSLLATLPAEELPGLAAWYLDDAGQQRLRDLVGRSEHLFTETVRTGMGAGDFVSLDEFLVERNRAERVWAKAYTFADSSADGEDRLAAMNRRRRLLDSLWRQLIAKVRSVYSGRLTLAANFDNYHEVGFWDALDLMGINAYFPLRATLETPLTEEALAASWRQIFDEIETFQAEQEHDLDVVFTELGYTRWRGVTVAPWSSSGFIPMWDPDGDPANDRAFFWETRPIEPEERAMALRALHRLWHEEPGELAGVLYWKLSSQADLQRFEPFMLYLGEDTDDPSLAALQGFAEDIRPPSPLAPGGDPWARTVDAILRGALSTLSTVDPRALVDPERPPLLHLAVRLGRRTIVRRLLDMGAGIARPDAAGFLPIHWACYQEDPRMVELLLPPEGTSWKDAAGETPLMKCARLDNVSVARELLAHDAEQIGARTTAGRSALHLAAEQASVEMVEALLTADAEPEATDAVGKTALHLAARRGALDIVRVLARDGCGQPDDEGNRPASEAAIHGRGEVFEHLFEPSTVRETNTWGQTLLHLAAHGGAARILETLLPHFPDVDPLDDDGFTPLAFATRNARTEAVELLLRHGAEIGKHNKEGTSALHLAAVSPETQLIRLLLEYQPDLALADGEGNTALHHAAGWGRLENLRLLLAAGAGPHLRNQAGQTALEVAEKAGRRRAVLLLRSAAATASDPPPTTDRSPSSMR